MILTTDYQLISTIQLTYAQVKTYAKVVSQDKTNNKTTYKLKSTYYIPTQNNVAFSNATASLGGESKSYGYTTFYKGESTIQEVTKTIEHNSDGSSPSVEVHTAFTASFGGSGSTSANITMPKIDRIPVITSITNITDEENPVITFTNPANFYLKAYLYTLGGYEFTRTNIKSPYTFTLTDTERNTIRTYMKNKKIDNNVFLTIEAYSSSNFSSSSLIGETTKSFTISIVNAEPTFTVAFAETNSKVSSLLGTSASKIVKNASKVKVSVTPAAKKNATIKSVEIIHGTSDVVKTASPYEQTLTALTNAYKVVVTDSRGYAVSQTITKTLIDYLPIEISQYSFKRVVPTSADIKLNASIVYKQQTFNTTANAPTLKWKLGADGTWNTISSSNYSIDTTNNEITISDLILSGVLPYTQSGKFYLSVSDLLTSDDENVTVTVGIPVFDYGEEDFQVNGDLFLADRKRQNKAALNVSGKVSKNLFNKNNYHVYDGYINGTSLAFISNTNGKTIYLKVQPNTTYTISRDILTSYFAIGTGSNVPVTGDVVSSYVSYSNSDKATITTGSNDNYIYIYLLWTTGTDVTLSKILESLQVELGSTATEYEEYYEPTILIRNSNGIFQEVEINKNNYSTVEQIIGTWINGKPLYRKVVVVDNPSMRENINHNIADIDEILDVRGTLKLSTGATKMLSSVYYNSDTGATDDYFAVSLYVVDNTRIRFTAGNYYVTGAGIPTKLTMILEYTKTTD